MFEGGHTTPLPATSRRAPATPPSTARVAFAALVASVALGVAGCGDSPVGPSVTPPAYELPATMTEWVESEPELRQRSHFHLDAHGRLSVWEFGHLVGGDSTWVTQRVEYDWSPEGRLREWVRSIRGDDGGFYATAIQRYRWEEGAVRIELSAWDERRDTVRTQTSVAHLDARGRVRSVVSADGHRDLHWEGDELTRIVSTPVDAPAQRLDLTPGRVMNPFYGLPPRPGFTIAFFPGMEGRTLPTAVTNRVVGESPAFEAMLIEESTDTEGRIERRVMELHNTSLPPDVRTRFVVEFDWGGR